MLLLRHDLHTAPELYSSPRDIAGPALRGARARAGSFANADTTVAVGAKAVSFANAVTNDGPCTITNSGHRAGAYYHYY